MVVYVAVNTTVIRSQPPQYVIKFVSDLRHTCRWVFFLRTPVSSTNNTDRNVITEILNTINHLPTTVIDCVVSCYLNLILYLCFRINVNTSQTSLLTFASEFDVDISNYTDELLIDLYYVYCQSFSETLFPGDSGYFIIWQFSPVIIRPVIMKDSKYILGTSYTAYTYCILYSILYKSSLLLNILTQNSRLFECGKNMTNSHAISHL